MLQNGFKILLQRCFKTCPRMPSSPFLRFARNPSKNSSKACYTKMAFFQSLLHKDVFQFASTSHQVLSKNTFKSPPTNGQESSNKDATINLQGLFKLCSKICSKSAQREDPKSVQKGSSSLLHKDSSTLLQETASTAASKVFKTDPMFVQKLPQGLLKKLSKAYSK